jgi:hypothetical protein
MKKMPQTNIIKGFLSRKYTDEQVSGYLTICDGDVKIFECVTLEPPYKDNQRNISCIPLGDYIVKPHVSPTFGKCFEIKDVSNRTHILIHAGNYNKDTKGCVLVGRGFADLNQDGLKDVTSSKVTLKDMLEKVTTPFLLLIR